MFVINYLSVNKNYTKLDYLSIIIKHVTYLIRVICLEFDYQKHKIRLLNCRLTEYCI